MTIDFTLTLDTTFITLFAIFAVVMLMVSVMYWSYCEYRKADRYVDGLMYVLKKQHEDKQQQKYN